MQFILPINLRKIPHIRQEHRHLHHPAQIATSLLQDLVNIFDAEGGFVGDGAGGEGAVCEGGELAGDVDCVGGSDGL